MRSALCLLLLATFPLTTAVKCYNGVGMGDNNNGVYAQLPCTGTDYRTKASTVSYPITM